MQAKLIFLCVACLPGAAQSPEKAKLDEQAAQLSGMVQRAPKLPLDKSRLTIQGPAAGMEIGYPSSVAMGRDGTIYVLHRGENADPVLAVDRDGRVVRSWGKGMFKIPHSIRVDGKGNIWTVDASSSMVYSFSPQGMKLMEISVGEQPTKERGFAGTTDIAFAPNGHLYISDGYGNARVLEYTPDGVRVRQWGSAGTGPGQFRQPHGIAIDDQGVVYVADRQNGRVQRFDLSGKYLGEWADLGMVTAVTIRDGSLWIGTQQRNEPTGADGWLMKIDRRSGRILGTVESGHAHHVLNITGAGEVLTGARPDTVWWFRARK